MSIFGLPQALTPIILSLSGVLLTLSVTISLKLLDLLWNKSFKDLKDVVDLSKSLDSNEHLKELLDLRQAQFAIRREGIKEHKRFAYASFHGMLLSQRSYHLRWIKPKLKYIVPIWAVFAVICTVGGQGLPILVGTVILMVQSLSLYWFLYTMRRTSLIGRRRKTYKYKATLLEAKVNIYPFERQFTDISSRIFEDKELAEMSSSTFKAKEFEVKSLANFKPYDYIGYPLRDMMLVYKRISSVFPEEKFEFSARGGEPIKIYSENPIEYELHSFHLPTLLELEWGATLNQLGTFLDRTCPYVPYIEEHEDTTPTGYYLIKKKEITEVSLESIERINSKIVPRFFGGL